MSGICGVWALDGGAAPALDPILSKLERRGPDGTRAWNEGPVALGHTLLATTPEAQVEQLPLTEPDSGCTITADARLDNREELIPALGLSGETRIIGDGELILRAYLKWGDESPGHLLGDFAFAIWDPREKHLFCARDHMGMRQLIYHHAPGRLFAFSTEAEGLVGHPSVTKRINEARIADFLDDLEGIDFTSTFFEEVFRLPPAHVMTIDSEGLSLRRYWELKAGPELKLDSDQAYADAFLEVFTEAVRCRLRSAGPVGSMLSGGMDSGSVVAVASRLLKKEGSAPLKTFSAVNGSVDCKETATLYHSSRLSGLEASFIDHTSMSGLLPALAESPSGTEPFDLHMTLIRAVYLSANQARVKVVFDGAAGDVVLTSGNRVAEFLRRGRPFAAFREARREEYFWGSAWPSWKILASAVWTAAVPRPIRDWRRRLLERRNDLQIPRHPVMTSEFANRIDLKSRRFLYRRHRSAAAVSGKVQRAQSIAHPHLAVARERYDRVAAATAIEPRDPFIDIRVIAFCLSLPANQLQTDGWPKMILRKAMIGLLPNEVIWRRGKEHLGYAFTTSLFSMMRGWQNRLTTQSGHLEKYVAAGALEQGNQSNGNALDSETKMMLFFLRSWIDRIQVRERIEDKNDQATCYVERCFPAP